MVRRTVTLNDFLYKQLQEIRGRLISKLGVDIGFTYILNIVILLGFCGTLSSEEEIQKVVDEFTLENYVNLELADLDYRLLELLKRRTKGGKGI